MHFDDTKKTDWLSNIMRFFKIIWLLMFLGHLFLLQMPIIGGDAWRNAQTYSVARNFVEEDFDILKPRYDMRMELEGGYYPGEFPLQTAILAVAMKTFGKTLTVARAVNLIFAIICAVLLFYVAGYLIPTNPITKYLVVTLFSVHSLLGYLTVAVMPEILSALLSLLSLCIFCRMKPAYWRISLTVIVLSIAALVKPTGVLVVVAIFFMLKDHKIPSLLEIFLYVIVPALVLKLWISYTMQFENFPYGNNYSLTHHYARTMTHFFNELSLPMIISAFEKSFVHGVNVAGLAFIFIMLYQWRKIFKRAQWDSILSVVQKYKLEFGMVAWALANFAFLIYAGNIQSNQTYYAMPLCIPLLIISSKYVAQLPLKFICLVVTLQMIWKIGYFQMTYIKYVEKWGQVRLEHFSDRFSTRNDLFLVFNNSYADFTLLGRVGRRGLNVCNPNDIKQLMKNFAFLYIEEKDLNGEIREILKNRKEFKFGGHYFYDLKSIKGNH